MLSPAFAVASLLLLAVPGTTVVEPHELDGIDWQQAAQQMQNVVIHVPRVTITRSTIVARTAPEAPPPSVRAAAPLIEGKTRDCVKMETIRGFAVSRGNSVDLMLSDGKAMRVKLAKDCPALSFYQGFYVKAHPDKKMCAGRDSIRSRSGRLCGVDELRSLVPAH